MNKLKLLPLLFLFLSFSLFSQDIDSLFASYSKSNRENRTNIANEIAQRVYDLQCTDTLFRMSNKTPNLLMDAIVNELMASHAMYIALDYELSNNFALKAAKIYEQLGDTLAADIMYGNMANNYLRMGNYQDGIALLLKCYELEEKTKDMTGLSVTLNSLGIAYSLWGDSQTAIEYFQRALETERPLNRPMQYATRLTSLAKEYKKLGQYEKALEYMKEALLYDEKIERREKEERIALHLVVMGDIYVDMDSLSHAGKCFDRALKTFSDNNQKNRLAEIYFSMGKLYMKRGEINKAIRMVEQSADICEQYNMKLLLLDSYHFLYEAYKQISPSSQALTYMEKYKTLGDSLFLERSQRQMSEFRIKYDTQQKEVDIIRQKAEIEKHRIRQQLFIGVLIIAVILVISLIYIINLRTKRNRILAEMNKTKDKFFTIISHDLKNPAIAQRDALQQLITHSDKWDVDSVSQYYEELLKSADGQVELLYNLLNWAQVQTGRMPYLPIQFDLVSELRSDIVLIKNMAERKGITLKIRMPDRAIITGDPNMLTTAIRNLLTNAVKFTNKGGSVTLEIQPKERGKYTISITDTGIGMSHEEERRIGTTGESGSGLGLIVCKEVIEKHGSLLQIDSEEGKGSVFQFTL